MADNREQITKLYGDTTQKIVSSWENWTNFLEAMGRLYKYPYHEQLMIYAQNPKATACAEVELWNKVMKRTLKAGANAIALLETNMAKSPVRYVFDIADTDLGQHGKELNQWQLSEENRGSVAEMLTKTYDLKESEDISNNIAMLSFSLARDYIENHPVDYREFAKGSQLEGLDLEYIEASVEHATAVSISYTLLHRMGLEAENFFTKEDFEPLLQLMSTENVTYLGTAISEQSEQVFREIEATIKNYEKEREHGTNLPQRGGISSSQPANEPQQGHNPTEVRQNEGELPETAQPTPVPPPASVGATGEPPVGNRQDSKQTAETPNGELDQGEPTSQQGGESTGMGSTHDQFAGTSRGNYLGGTDFQLNQEEKPQEIQQTSLFPSVAQQVADISQQVAVEHQKPVEKFTLTEQEISEHLRKGTGKVDGRLRIYEMFQQDLGGRERLEAIKNEFNFYGFNMDFAEGKRGFVEYSPSVGMTASLSGTGEKHTIP